MCQLPAQGGTCHSRRILQENVLISDDGKALLADFGLSTTIDKLGRATATEVRLWNTLSFAAPEATDNEVKTDEPDELVRAMLDIQVPMPVDKTETPAPETSNEARVVKKKIKK